MVRSNGKKKKKNLQYHQFKCEMFVLISTRVQITKKMFITLQYIKGLLYLNRQGFNTV